MNTLKKLFSTPGRAIATTLACVLILGLLGAGIAITAIYFDHKEEVIESRIEQEVAERLYGNDSGASAGDDAATADSGSGVSANTQKLSAEEAEEIALQDAGFARGDVKSLYSHIELDDGLYQYDVSFRNGNYEYEYSVNAEDGMIIEKDFDHIFD